MFGEEKSQPILTGRAKKLTVDIKTIKRMLDSEYLEWFSSEIYNRKDYGDYAVAYDTAHTGI